MPHPHQAITFTNYQRKQHGAALMVMLVIMVMGAATFLVSSLSRSALQIQQNQNSSQILVQAKEVVLGYVLNGSGGSQRPGELMYPDVLSSSESPTNYDGASESGCFDSTKPTASPPYTPLISSNISNMRCIGRLPWNNLSMAISNPTENDPTGFMPWYMFSRNLIDPNTPINSGLLNTYPYPWLTVRDMKGNMLSSRVAIVIIVPGAALPGQSRPPSPNLGGPDQYLDSITVQAGCTAPCVQGIYKNYDLDDDYIMGDEHRWIPDPNNPANQIEDSSYQFNDKLIYITIDELMPVIVKRAAGEARSALKSYYNANTHFPDASALGSSGTYTPVSGNDSGMLPIDLGTCSCTSSSSCSCAFGLVASAAFKRGGSSTWSTTSGECTRTPTTQTCTCTGVGYCNNSSGSKRFTCDSSGNCDFIGIVSGNFIFSPPPNRIISSTTGGCSLNVSNAQCSSSGSFKSIHNNSLSSFQLWFTDNLWQDYFYYHRSNTSSLQAGTQGNIQALVIGAGAPIVSAPFASKGSAQTRPSSNINDYLDSAENTNGDLLFDATNKPRSSSYNDQVFIVAPWP